MGKLLLILRRRWIPLAVLALIGLVAGTAVAFVRNAGIETLFRADATVVLIRQADDTSGRQLTNQLSEYQRTAIRVNQDVLEPDTAEISVETGETEGLLIFTGFGPSGGDASQIATGMRTVYFETAPVGVQAVEQDLANYAAQVDAIRAEIADLESQDEGDPVINRAAELLSAEIFQLQNQAVQLAVDLVLYEFGTQERLQSEIRAELETTQAALEARQVELADLDLEPTVNTERDLRILALQQQESQITQQYLELFLNQAETAALTSAGTVLVGEVSAQPVPVAAAAIGGLLLAVLVGIGAVLLFDFVRKPIWSEADLIGVPVIGTLAPRSSNASRRHFPWYLYARPGPRLDGIQAIRASLNGVATDDPTVIGVLPVGVPSAEVKRAAADIAASFAAVSKDVLLMDTEFGTVSGLPEFGSLTPTLSDFLHPRSEQSELRPRIKSALADLAPSMPGLKGMSAGYMGGHATDALGGPALAVLFEEGRSASDVVVVATPEVSDPAALTVSQKADQVILVGQVEMTRISEVKSAIDRLTSRHVEVLGFVLLESDRLSSLDRLRSIALFAKTRWRSSARTVRRGLGRLSRNRR